MVAMVEFAMRSISEDPASSMKAKFTAILRFEESVVVALSPELDIASQGATPQEALANLKEAVGLFLECASPVELEGST